MDVVIDIGNTQTKIAFFKGAVLQDVKQFSSEDIHELDVLIASNSPEKGIVSSVSKDVNSLMARFPNVQWHLFSAQSSVPFTNLYATKSTLGLDRIALVVAAVNQFPNQNTLVIDAGTCVTYDFVNSKGEYLGGSISPGLEMRLRAMHTFTAKLPLVPLQESVYFIGSSTETCLQSGALFGLTAEIDGIIQQYQREFDNLMIVLTGGNTKVVARLVKSGIFARQNFLIEGLHEVLTYNYP